MALIIVTGYPCSGKSTTSKKILDYLKVKLAQNSDSRQIRIVTDSDNLDWDGRDIIYMSIPKEKELRGWLRSEAQRYINLNQIVILDAAAYIKGFRYELFCMTKEAKGRYCIVEKLIDPELCWKWNGQVEAAQSDNQPSDDAPNPFYSKDVFDALVLRYEKCDETNRWDSPLFRLNSENDDLNLEELYNIVTNEGPLMPNKCTALTTTSTTIYKQ